MILISLPDASTLCAVGALEQTLDYLCFIFTQSAKCKLVYPVCGSVRNSYLVLITQQMLQLKPHMWIQLQLSQMSVRSASVCYDEWMYYTVIEGIHRRDGQMC